MRVLGIEFRTQKAWKAYLLNLGLDTIFKFKTCQPVTNSHLSVGDRASGNNHKQHILNFSDYFMPKSGIIHHWMTVYIKTAKY